MEPTGDKGEKYSSFKVALFFFYLFIYSFVAANAVSTVVGEG